MKKVVRMLGLCALVALAFTACKKNDTQKVSFTATMPQTTTDARTHVQGMDLVWDEGNAIAVVNGEGVVKDFTLVSATDKVATFTAEGADAEFVQALETADYTAFYPNAVEDGNSMRLAIPAVQNYTMSGVFVNDLYPMVGFNDGSNFVFQSNCGFLNVSFKAPENESRQIDRVILIANEDIAGDMVYAKDGLSYVFEGVSNVITMTCEGKQTCYGDLPRDFTFVLPEGVLADGFTVEVYDGETLLGTFTTQNPQNVIVAQQFRNMYAKVLN